MKSLFFIIRRTLKNIVKGIFKKPLVIIGYVFVLLFVALLLFMSFFMPSELVSSSPPETFKGIVTLVFTFMYFTYLRIGVDKGSTYFRMADVNLAFTAPIRPNKIMLYAFVKQIGSTLLFLFIAICQIPNIKNNFAVKPYGAALILVAAIIFALTYPLINMVVYSWASKKPKRKSIIKWILNVSALALAAVAVINIAITRNLGTTIQSVFNHPIANYFPVIGWTASIANAAVLGFTIEFWVGLISMTILLVGGSIALYKMNLDYYEDVLEGTEYLEAAVKAKREGNDMRFNLKVKDNIKQKLTGKGSAALFYKRLVEMRKTSIILFFDRASLTVIITSIVVKLISGNDDSGTSMIFILVFALYMQLIMQVKGRINTELDKHYIFLIPESSPKKLFYATLAEHIKNLIDGVLLFTISGIMFKETIPIIIVCAVTYAIFGAVYIYTDILSMRVFGGVHSKGLLVFLKIIVNLFIFIPGIIAAVFAGILTESIFYAICAVGGWSLILSITLFMFSSGILNNLETTS